jgi:hypothetical protein
MFPQDAGVFCALPHRGGPSAADAVHPGQRPRISVRRPRAPHHPRDERPRAQTGISVPAPSGVAFPTMCGFGPGSVSSQGASCQRSCLSPSTSRKDARAAKRDRCGDEHTPAVASRMISAQISKYMDCWAPDVVSKNLTRIVRVSFIAEHSISTASNPFGAVRNEVGRVARKSLKGIGCSAPGSDFHISGSDRFGRTQRWSAHEKSLAGLRFSRWTEQNRKIAT